MITGPRNTVKRARKLRTEMSLPEVKLWEALRKRPGGFKFRRQHSAGEYVIDFYCASCRLAIEVDGSAHDSEQAAARDARRSAWLRSQGVATLRVPARVVLEDIDAAVVRIVEVCRERGDRRSRLPRVPLHHPSDGPPPRAGED
jgi:very-short-patch-repair endonuclease